MTKKKIEWSGTFAATLCPFRDDESIDDEGLREYIARLLRVAGLHGLTCNGHTGEIMSLRPEERAFVTAVVAQAVNDSGASSKVISGVSAEGSFEAIDHALAAKEAGADAILLMPPHHWLRFGRSVSTAIGFVGDVARGADIPIVLHQYPAWTRASYSLAEMLEIAQIPEVVSIKMGTRDMSRWLYDRERLDNAAPNVSVLTCHDEFLLPTLLEGADGALVGLAGFAPQLVSELVQAASRGDLAVAKSIQRELAPLVRMIYNFGEPGCEAHQRMKTALWLMGDFPSSQVRRPLRPLPDADVERIRSELELLGYRCTSGVATQSPSRRTQISSREN